jgi:MFS family permease
MTGADLAADGLALDAAPTANPARTWASSTFAAFEFPLYRLVWWGSFLGFLAFNMSSTAQSVVAYDITGNDRAVGTVMFGQGLAMILLNPFGGAIADRLNKRFLIIATQTVIGSVILAIALLLATGRISILWLAVGSFTTGAMFSVLGPTRTALLGDIVNGQRIGNAMALLQVGGNFGRICAPFLAGALIAWPVVGPTGTYFCIATMMIFVLVTMSHIPTSAPRARKSTSVLDDVRQGLGYARSNPRLLHSMISYYAVTALGYTFMVVMPGFVKQDLHAGTAGIGAILGIAAAGGFVGSVTVAGLADSRRAPLFLKLSSVMTAIALLFVGFAPSFATAAFVMIFVAGGIASFQTLNNAVALRSTDPAYYGRVMGLMQIAWGLINLISLPTGFIADATGERAVLSGAGLLLGCTVVLLALWDRRIAATERAETARAVV